jgi:transcriptional regulator with XRE-family HTH domain
MPQQMPTPGSSIRALRKLAGMTLEQVGAAADTAPAYLSKVETNKLKPAKEYVSRIVNVIAAELSAIK